MAVTTSQTPTLDFLLTDPDAGDLITQYRWQIGTDPAFATALQDLTVTGSWASGSHVTVVPATLPRGATYYVRAVAFDGTVWGAWSTTFSFLVAAAPTVTLTEPSAAGRLGKLLYQTGWLSPRLEVDWTFACPDGGTQRDYRVEVNSDSTGSPGASFNDSTTLTDAAARQRIVPATFVEGSYYHVRVTVTCSHGMTAVVGYYRLRVRWGVVTHRHDMGAPTASLALTTLDVTDETTGGAGHVTMEYATTTGTGAPATWQATIGAAGLNRYVWYRAWLLAWGASPAVSPALNQIKVTYTTAQIIPDKWVRSDATNQSGDVAAYVYGTKSFRMLGKGSAHWASQQIPVAPNTDYVLSGRIQSLGNSGAYISVASAADSGDLVKTTPLVVSVDFEHPEYDPATGIPGSRVFTIPWNSGSNTSIYIRMVMDGAVGTTSWFDALKMEASTVVTPWSPGYIANAVVLDSGGLQIDAYAGGIFRLRGGSGLPADVIELGMDGLYQGGAKIGGGVYVGNSPPASPGNGQLWWDDDDATKGGGQGFGMGTSFPASPAVYDRFYRTDLLAEFVWTGSQWLDINKQPAPGWFLQSGNATPGSSGSGPVSAQLAVTFPIPFSGVPVVMLTPINYNWYAALNGAAPTNTGFTFAVYRAAGGTGQGVQTMWLAWGPR